jgi:hypothetical protein
VEFLLVTWREADAVERRCCLLPWPRVGPHVPDDPRIAARFRNGACSSPFPPDGLAVKKRKHIFFIVHDFYILRSCHFLYSVIVILVVEEKTFVVRYIFLYVLKLLVSKHLNNTKFPNLRAQFYFSILYALRPNKRPSSGDVQCWLLGRKA